MAVLELSDKGPDGTRLGQSSTDLVGFYGKTPAVRYASSVVAPASTAAVSFAATPWGFSGSAQADAVIRAVYHMATAFAGYGLVSSS